MLDPMGLYQIADSLAIELVPAVRERMQRVRFLTAMTVGALVADGLEDNPRNRDASPYLVWEWFVVEALVRTYGDDDALWGVPGTLVGRRALNQHGYLDSRSYLKTPRIFGFNGVYKRMAIHLGLMDLHLAPGPNADGLVDAWARGIGFSGLQDAKPLISRWRSALSRSLNESPPRTKAAWGNAEWNELAAAFSPWESKSREKRYIRDLLLAADERRLGALQQIWNLQSEIEDEKFTEEHLHNRLRKHDPTLQPLLDAILRYEEFARSLQDGFDLLLADAAIPDGRGFLIADVVHDKEFVASVANIHERFASATQAIGEAATPTASSLQHLFEQRFSPFSQPMDAGACAAAVCAHHEAIQKAKSADGKRPWFDRLGPGLIYVRHQYREGRRPIQPGRYVHDYRGWPIRRFYRDLT